MLANGEEVPLTKEGIKEKYFAYYDDVKDKSLKRQDWWIASGACMNCFLKKAWIEPTAREMQTFGLRYCNIATTTAKPSIHERIVFNSLRVTKIHERVTFHSPKLRRRWKNRKKIRKNNKNIIIFAFKRLIFLSINIRYSKNNYSNRINSNGDDRFFEISYNKWRKYTKENYKSIYKKNNLWSFSIYSSIVYMF